MDSLSLLLVSLVPVIIVLTTHLRIASVHHWVVLVLIAHLHLILRRKCALILVCHRVQRVVYVLRLLGH